VVSVRIPFQLQPNGPDTSYSSTGNYFICSRVPKNAILPFTENAQKIWEFGKIKQYDAYWPWISQKGDLLSLLKSSLAQALTEPTPKAQKRRPSKLKFPKKMPEMAKKCPKNMSYMLFSVIYGS